MAVHMTLAPCVYSVDKSLSGEEDLDISGIVLTQQHLNTVLANLQSTQSDFIGAPKVRICFL